MSEYGVYQAINQVQADLAFSGISKDRKNQTQGYAFRGIDDIYNALSGCLSKRGLCIIPRYLSREFAVRETKSGGVLYSVTVEAEFDLVGPDGSKHTARTFGEAMDSADKATNKAMSAAYKYMCLQVFAIPTEGDNDADAYSPEASRLVAERRIAELSSAAPSRNTQETQERIAKLDAISSEPQAAEAAKRAPRPAKPKESKAFDMLEAFSAIKKEMHALAGNDERYYAVLGAQGYEKSNMIQTREEGVKVYRLLGVELSELRRVAEDRKAAAQRGESAA